MPTVAEPSMGRPSWPPAFPPFLYAHLLVEERVGTPTSTEEVTKRELSGLLPWQFPLLPSVVIITVEVTYCFPPTPGSHYSRQEKSAAADASEVTDATAGQLPGGNKPAAGDLVWKWQQILSIFMYPCHMGIPDKRCRMLRSIKRN